MGWYFLIGVLAAFGVVCILWILYGGLLGKTTGGVLVCLCDGSREEALLLRYSQLRSAGLLSCPLILADSSLSLREQEILCRRHPGVEFCTMAQLPGRLEMDKDRCD